MSDNRISLLFDIGAYRRPDIAVLTTKYMRLLIKDRGHEVIRVQNWT